MLSGVCVPLPKGQHLDAAEVPSFNLRIMKNSLSKEEKLVLESVREADGSGEHLASVKSLVSSGIDWDHFLKIANSGGAEPLIFFNLEKQHLLDYFPPYLTDKLKKSYLLSLRRNLIIENSMTKLLRGLCFETEIIVLKGPVLMKTAYEDIGLRPFVDLDLLIKRKDLAYIHNFLLKKWEFQYSEGEKIHSSIDYYGSKSNGILPKIVSIRWELIRFEGYNFAMGWDTQSVWERSVLANVYNQGLRTLSPEDAILYHCYHLGIQHLFGGLIWYVDLMKMIKMYGKQLDWQNVIERAKNYGIKKVLSKVLLFTHEKLGAKIPSRILKPLNKDLVSKFVIDKKFSGFTGLFLQTFLFDNLKKTLKTFFCIIFPSREFLYLNFNSDKLEDKIVNIRRPSKEIIYLYLKYLRHLSKKFIHQFQTGHSFSSILSLNQVKN